MDGRRRRFGRRHGGELSRLGAGPGHVCETQGSLHPSFSFEPYASLEMTASLSQFEMGTGHRLWLGCVGSEALAGYVGLAGYTFCSDAGAVFCIRAR